MSKYSGYMGKVMMMDLTTGEVEEYPWTDRDRELYIGGKADSMKDGIELAKKFLADNNFLDMHENYYEETEKYLTINFMPIKNKGMHKVLHLLGLHIKVG